MKELFKKKYFRIALGVLLCILMVYTLIYIDVLLRARSAYLQGEKYWSWYENPELKKSALSEEFDKDKKKIDKELSKNRITEDEYNKQLEILKFNYEQKLKESSIKYAYIWYQTVVELFSPPESKWVKLSREKMLKAKELWKQELRDKNIPFEDYMID